MKEIRTKKTILFKTETITKPKKRFIIISEKKNLFVPEIKGKNQNIIQPQFLRKKTYLFRVDKIEEEKNINEGRWNTKEQITFLEALDKYGVDWKIIRDVLLTRTPNQIKSHAQKFFNKIKKYKDDKLGIDLTLDSIQNIKDAIRHIKSINNDYSIFDIFSQISELHNKKNSKNTKQKEYINNIFLEEVNINNVYNKYTIYNKDIPINKQKSINHQISNTSINSADTINTINNSENKELNKIANNYSINNNTFFVNTSNYNYLNYSIINNVVNIMNNISNDALNNYLNNINNYIIGYLS